MSKNKTEGKEELNEEIREKARLIWKKERQIEAVKENEPIKDIFRVTVAIDVVTDGTDAARAAVKDLKGKGVFVYGIKGVRRLEPLFKTSDEFKAITKEGKEAK